MDKAALLFALRSDVKEIEVKALGVALYFRVLTGKARDAFHAAVNAGDKTVSHFQASLVAATVVDAEGKAMFSAEDVAAVQDSNAQALEEIAGHAMTVNNIGVQAEAEAAKN